MAGLAVKLGALFFALFAIVHVIRIVQNWEVNIGGHDIPMTASYVAAGVSLFMAVGLWRACPKKKD